MDKNLLVFGFLAFAAVVGGCSSGGAASCAPPGVYVIRAVRRSADPGNCPATIELPFKWGVVEVKSGDELCDHGTAHRTVGDPKANYCSYEISMVGSVSSTEVTARASVTLYHCPATGGSTCTANFDLTYTRQSEAADAAIAAGGATVPGGTGGSLSDASRATDAMTGTGGRGGAPDGPSTDASGGLGGAPGTGGSFPGPADSGSSPGCKPYSPEGCGDGINNQGGIEECDDGNALPGDGCNGRCKVEPYWACPRSGSCARKVICGDGSIGPGEVCDDGNTKNGDGCNSTCTVQDPAFLCVPGQPCVRVSQCGNKRIEPGENCDDGNTGNGDGCSSSCQLDPGWVCPVPGKLCQLAPAGCTTNNNPGCGDGIVNGTEACDDCVNDGEYGTCNPDCTLAPRCRDGIVQADYGEECEPTMSDDPSCTPACRKPGGCGDGKIEPPEQCDDGAMLNNGKYGGCAPSCIYAPRCGDCVKNGPEECDDGILDASYGGCSPQCKLGPHCGDGIANGPEECDHGNQNGLDGECTAWCKKIVLTCT
jgi:cysteine-rich repeat protein